jgi:hypothetical protein
VKNTMLIVAPLLPGLLNNQIFRLCMNNIVKLNNMLPYIAILNDGYFGQRRRYDL